MMLFLDVTALAARYLESPGSAAIRDLLRREQEEGCAISSISIPTFSLLLCDLKLDGIPDGTLIRAAEAFHEDLHDFVQIQVDACLPQAGQFTLRHGLRLEPAIQLAAARNLEDRLELNARNLSPPLVKMVTLSPALALAAQAEGLVAAPAWAPPG